MVRGLTRFSLVSWDISGWMPNSTWASGESSRVWQKVCHACPSPPSGPSWALRLSTSSSLGALPAAVPPAILHPEEGGQDAWQAGVCAPRVTRDGSSQGGTQQQQLHETHGDGHGRGRKRGRRGAGQASRPAFLSCRDRESRSNTALLTAGPFATTHPLILHS